MITLREAAAALYGAYRLARLDPSGMRHFDVSIGGFWRSFNAAAIALPFYAALVLLRLDYRPVASDSLRIFLVEVIAYAIGWTAFPLAAFYLTQALDRTPRYPGYIVAYNWAAVLQVAAYLIVTALLGLSLRGTMLGTAFELGVFIAVLFYQYFIARVALDVDAMPAIGLVLTDFLLSALIETIVGALEQG
jgi:hypothetical protein